MTSVALAALKFLALGTATTLGVLATLTRTRDEVTNKVTQGGRILVILIIVSGVLSAVTQSVELYLTNVERRKDRAERFQEYEVLYDLAHPLGQLDVLINATYPIVVKDDGFGTNWLRRVGGSFPKSERQFILNNPKDPLRPNENMPDEQEVFDVLVNPVFKVSINHPQKHTNSKRFSGYDDLLFITTSPALSRIHVHLDEGKVDSQIGAAAVRIFDKGTIRSWRDLYGATVEIEFPVGAPLESKLSRCTLSFSSGERISLKGFSIPSEGLNVESTNSHPSIGCKFVLTEEQLGPMPKLLD